MLEATAHDLKFSVTSVAADVVVQADRQILASVVGNLIQNAFKFTKPGGHVFLCATVADDRVLIHVEDQCGGLPPGRAEELFRPFAPVSYTHLDVYKRQGLGVAVADGLGVAVALGLGVAVADGDVYKRQHNYFSFGISTELNRLAGQSMVPSLGLSLIHI